MAEQTPSARAIDLANRLLAGGGRYNREANVVADLESLLVEVGIDLSEIEREHPSGKGRIDIYVPRYRVIVEAKAGGKAADPDERQAGQAESPSEQLERYMNAEISAEWERFPLGGTSYSARSWTGIITDGQHWHAYLYPHVGQSIDRRKPLHSGRVSGGGDALAAMLLEWLSGDPVGRKWIPADPKFLFEGHAKELAELYNDLPDEVRRSTETKLALWHDMLRVSGMSPKGKAAPERLFVTHSFLISVARMVSHSLTRGPVDWKGALKEGFVGWVLGWSRGSAWASGLWEVVRGHDWRRRRGDVLRSLYEMFVPEPDRKVFGEFYTPDWLAAMMVEQALDQEWVENAIQRAEDAIQNSVEFNGCGVLDPSCGSGTFLYHAALRLLDAPAMQGLTPTQQADVSALLLNGIDVHPVAVEIARANLMRVLPVEPSAGESALRVHLGDSLLASEDRDSLFGHVQGSMRLVTPEEREILIPVEFVKQDGFADSMRRLVEAAASGDPVPRAVLNGVPRERRQDLKRSRDDLAAAIGEEGNSVWTWYAVNVAAPHLLSERKVDRIVANPPWVKLADIQEPRRKRAMEGLGERLGLQAGGRQSPHLDIASFFVLRARELYLNTPRSDPAVWLVKKSALRAGHWKLFRSKHAKTLTQSIDLERVQPFGGGDARRCCLLMEHLRFVERTEESLPLIAQQKVPSERPRLEVRLGTPSGVAAKPRADDSWVAVRPRLEFVEAPALLPQAPSDYALGAFRQGATIVPHVLLVAERTSPSFGKIRVRTRKSTKRPWSNVSPQEVEIPKRWMSRLYRSAEMLPFVAASGNTQAIIPVDEHGALELESALEEAGWQVLNETYQQHRGQGQGTPKTLAAQIDFAGKLSSQPRNPVAARHMVLYPKSGDNMRSARTHPGSGIVADNLYWHIASSEEEAGYLTVILNAPCLNRAFRESKESGRDFHLHPWRKVPIPRFDSGDPWHAGLAELCRRAEKAADSAAEAVQARSPHASQAKISKAIRHRLSAIGVFRAIDDIVARLLPNQAVRGYGDSIEGGRT